MNYEQALKYIEETHKFGVRLGLDNIKKLLELLENPQEKLNIIHIAGTNGKGSTCSFVASILKEGGFKVGLYTSPFLETFTERIRINGENIKEEDVADIVTTIKEKIDIMVNEGFSYPTEFEIVTAMALYHYAKEKTDYVVLEVGMGGRYDATNIIEKSLVSAITPVSLDHIGVLGDTVAKIAYEKAGIIKENGTAIVYKQEKEAEEVIIDVCKSLNAKYIEVDFEDIKIKNSNINYQIYDCTVFDEKFEDIKINLIGDHQIYNSKLALTIIMYLVKNEKLTITKEDILSGLEKTRWPGRIEKILDNPIFIIDGAHNEDGAQSLANSIDKYLQGRDINLVIGMLEDKDIDSVLQILIPRCKNIITTVPDSPRAISAQELKNKIEKFTTNVIAKEKIEDAIDYVLENTNKDEIIISAGSLYMIGTVRTLMKNRM